MTSSSGASPITGLARAAIAVAAPILTESKRGRQRQTLQAEMVPFAAGCQWIGITPPGASKILTRSSNELPPIVWLGRRRYFMRRHLEQWINARLALGTASGDDARQATR